LNLKESTACRQGRVHICSFEDTGDQGRIATRRKLPLLRRVSTPQKGLHCLHKHLVGQRLAWPWSARENAITIMVASLPRRTRKRNALLPEGSGEREARSVAEFYVKNGRIRGLSLNESRPARQVVNGPNTSNPAPTNVPESTIREQQPRQSEARARRRYGQRKAPSRAS
jgi:hypothetical protein